MNLVLEKAMIINEIQSCNEEWVLKAIKKILYKEEIIDIEQYNQELDNAEKQIANGEFVSHFDLIEKMKACRKKLCDYLE